MHDADVRDVEMLVGLLPQTLHLADGHRWVGFVDKIKRAAAACPLASVTVKRYGGAASREDDSAGDGADIDRCGG